MSKQTPTTLGQVLKAARETAGYSLRDVERVTKKRLSNGHVSLLESDAVKHPSPHHLFILATTLSLDYATLLRLAGYVVPGEFEAIGGDPDKAELVAKVVDFTADERQELDNYIQYIRSKRSAVMR
jgi:transcriptional regulator with XRE-family HTH domain